MGVRVLVGVEDDDSGGRAVLYCSTSMRALPFLFQDQDDAEEFLAWVHGGDGEKQDLRRYDAADQEKLFTAWQRGLHVLDVEGRTPEAVVARALVA